MAIQQMTGIGGKHVSVFGHYLARDANESHMKPLLEKDCGTA